MAYSVHEQGVAIYGGPEITQALWSGFPSAAELMEGRDVGDGALVLEIDKYAIGRPGHEPVEVEPRTAAVVRALSCLAVDKFVEANGLAVAGALPCAPTASVKSKSRQLSISAAPLRLPEVATGEPVIVARRRNFLDPLHGLAPVRFVDAPARQEYGLPLSSEQREQVVGAMTGMLRPRRLAATASDRPRPQQWRWRAACRDEDPELFFPVTESQQNEAAQRQIAEAKAVCGRCVVQAECLTEALARVPDGIAGGMTEQERKLYAERSA